MKIQVIAMRNWRPRWALAGIGALAMMLALGLAPSAQAGNVAPNPSFEVDCGGKPCNWTVNVSAGTIARDTSTAHSGQASLKETSDAFGTPGAVSDCIPVAAGTDVTRSFWYSTTSDLVGAVIFNLKFFASSDCSDLTAEGPINLFTTSPVADGNWHQLMDPLESDVFPGNNGAQATLFFLCTFTCPAGVVVNFDDVIMGSGPLAVQIQAFTGKRLREGVLVRWRTGTEADLLGFHVYRAHGHSWRRITRSLIAARGSVSGASYRFLDKAARRGVSYSYRIKAVNRDGTASWFGPVRVA
jgi:hypothetical protein